MFAYWVMFGIYAVGAVLASGTPKNRQNSSPLFIGAAALIIAWMGFRYEVGGDWYNYLEIFSEYGNNSFDYALSSARGDPAFGILNWLLFKLDLGVWPVNLVSAFVLIWGIVKFSKKQPNPWLVTCVALPYLIIVVGMGYVRQGVAIGFLLAAISVFSDKRYGRFIVYCILATAFHKSAIIAIPLIVLSEERHKLTVYGVGLALGALLFSFFIDSFLSRLVTNYVDSEVTSQGAGVRVLMIVLPALVFLPFRKRFARSPHELRLWTLFSLAALGCAALYLLSSASTAEDRVALLLIPLQLFVLSRLPYAFSSKGGPDKLLLVLVLAYSAAVQFVWLTYGDNAHWWLPYKTYLSTD
jgi:hypothetical protein